MTDGTDWSAWSREAVQLMQKRNEAFQDRFQLKNGSYHWDIDQARIVFSRDDAEDVEARLVVVGTLAAEPGTFLWGWANHSHGPSAMLGLERVRTFGEANDLGLLTTAEFPADRAQGLELVAIAGRLLDADGFFIDSSGDTTLFFALFDFKSLPKQLSGDDR